MIPFWAVIGADVTTFRPSMAISRQYDPFYDAYELPIGQSMNIFSSYAGR
jgi:hypothetical protein